LVRHGPEAEALGPDNLESDGGWPHERVNDGDGFPAKVGGNTSALGWDRCCPVKGGLTGDSAKHTTHAGQQKEKCKLIRRTASKMS